MGKHENLSHSALARRVVELEKDYAAVVAKLLVADAEVYAMREGDRELRDLISALGIRFETQMRDVQRQRDDLLEANNRYLQRARDAEAKLAERAEQ